ncbi:MAG: mucin desulfatase [Planctomycetes bacterium]|nr:mucin desulfatase [Planctomycetota bacterium]
MSVCSPESAQDAVKYFAIEGDLRSLTPFHRGHIHDTYISAWETDGAIRRYLHQRLNRHVFQDIAGLMHNIEHVVAHLERKLANSDEPDFRVLRLIPTVDGDTWSANESGAWRTYEYIENTIAHDACEGTDEAYQAARAFGRFQYHLRDLDVEALHETIPNFFSSPFRLRQLQEAIAQDKADRVSEVEPEIRFVRERLEMVDVIDDHLRKGSFPRRIVHGDTKLNNVLFDRDTGRAVSVVDLDTCMAGWTLYDFGDLVRFTAASCAEDEPDLGRAGVNLDLYRALVDGYLEGSDGTLTAVERELMPFAARLVTFTLGLRFLADHLAGDTYFKVARDGHNLDRARVQFRMVERMEELESSMRVGTERL